VAVPLKFLFLAGLSQIFALFLYKNTPEQRSDILALPSEVLRCDSVNTPHVADATSVPVGQVRRLGAELSPIIHIKTVYVGLS